MPRRKTKQGHMSIIHQSYSYVPKGQGSFKGLMKDILKAKLKAGPSGQVRCWVNGYLYYSRPETAEELRVRIAKMKVDAEKKIAQLEAQVEKMRKEELKHGG